MDALQPDAQAPLSVVDYIDEMASLLGDAPFHREARLKLWQILDEVREEHDRLQQADDTGAHMTARQWGYLEALGYNPTGEDEPTRKQAARQLLKALELAMFQRHDDPMPVWVEKH